jgi:hypothetical protein
MLLPVPELTWRARGQRHRDRGREPPDSGELQLIGDGSSSESKGTTVFLLTSRIYGPPNYERYQALAMSAMVAATRWWRMVVHRGNPIARRPYEVRISPLEPWRT